MKAVLITGSTDGIGEATSKQLQKRGWRVLLHGRNNTKLAQSAQKLGIDQKDTYLADFADMGQVKDLAKKVVHDHKALDALINNAGVFMHERVITKDGFETTMAVNHFAHWLLTHHLLDLLKAAPQGRVITVSSMVHRNGRLDLDNLDFHEDFEGYRAYATSKLANILFSNQLANRLKGTKVTSNSLHPGVINTKLLREGFHFIGRSTTRGAKTSVYLADSEEVTDVSGKYFENSRQAEPSAAAQNAQLGEQFWRTSQQLLQPFLR